MVLSVMGLHLLNRKDFPEGEVGLRKEYSAGMTDRPLQKNDNWVAQGLSLLKLQLGKKRG